MVDDLEALRRRVYGADATPEDVARYRAVLDGRAAPVPAPDASPEAAGGVEPGPSADGPGRPARARARRRRGSLAGLAVAGVVVLALAAVLLPRPSPPPGPPPVPLVISAARSAELVDHLREGGEAGIGAYLITTKRPVPALDDATRYFVQEDHGEGPGTVRVDPSELQPGPGRATVVLVLERAARMRWRVDGLEVVAGGAIAPHPLRTRSADQQAGRPTSDTFRYAEADRPTRLVVDVPAGVRWGVALVFTD